MLKWMLGEKKGSDAYKELYNTVTEGIQTCYRENMLPLESASLFHQCYAPRLTDADFAAKPMVLLMGQYSTGKSSFIRHLLERDYPGLRIGPEPTTDKFVTVMHGKTDRIIPGNALVVDNTMPFTQLANFGNNFLQRLECVQLNNPILEGLTFIDTPGVLSGEKQRLQRGYDFEGVIKWFADRSDLVILLFDAHKLDISDEFKRCIHQLKGNDSKIKIVLNKADRISTQQLMRVYGAMMWSLGKVIHTPEVARVFLGSFWDQPLENDEQRKLFEMEENDLYTAISALPRNSATRQLNDLIKRARLLRVHSYLMDHFRKEMPTLWGGSSKQRELIRNLGSICQSLSKQHSLPLGDFPNVQALQRRLTCFEFSKLQTIDPKQIQALQKMLERDVQKLLKLIPSETLLQEPNAKLPFQSPDPSPFAVNKEGGVTEATYLTSQYLQSPPDTRKYERDFVSIGPDKEGKISGLQAKTRMELSKLNNGMLHKIWKLADVDKDGKLSLYEYALAQHFIEMKLQGLELPSELPECMEKPPPVAPAHSSSSSKHSGGEHKRHITGHDALSGA
ncbi:unnamed protein product [Amoebophrya sp. A120]|nr:unnamed protein product [Amoebophrya sp. A120]|eukprot:GSA120T00001697001.1